MKRVLMAIALAAAASGVASAGVSKDELRKLITAGFSDDLILAYVKANDGVERLSADDLIELKRAGATDALLVAVLVARAEPRVVGVVDRASTEVIRPERRTPGRHPGVIDLGGLPYWSPRYGGEGGYSSSSCARACDFSR